MIVVLITTMRLDFSSRGRRVPILAPVGANCCKDTVPDYSICATYYYRVLPRFNDI